MPALSQLDFLGEELAQMDRLVVVEVQGDKDASSHSGVTCLNAADEHAGSWPVKWHKMRDSEAGSQYAACELTESRIMRHADADSVRTLATKAASRHTVVWFVVWLALGAVLAFSFVDGFAFGLFVFPFAIAGITLLIVRHHLDRSAWGLLCGIGLLSLAVAYVQRQGPGTVTWHTATASGSETYLDPRPWLVVGLLLVLVGIVAFLWQEHHRAFRHGVAQR